MAEIYGSNAPGTAPGEHRSKWVGIAIAVVVVLAILVAYAAMRG
jgi:hypothetical protein